MPPQSYFPDPRTADEDGLVAITETMTAELLLDAYTHGIFPWSENPVRWYCPEPRAVFVPSHMRLPKKLGKMQRRGNFTVRFDTAFAEVMRACAAAHRDDGVWIGESFIACYSELHRRGFAHSVEVWQDEALVGGLYGVQIGAMFAGESMFYERPNASKIAFAYLVAHLGGIGVRFIDAQVLNEHTARLGAVLVHRDEFLDVLAQVIGLSTTYEGQRWPAQPRYLPPGA